MERDCLWWLEDDFIFNVGIGYIFVIAVLGMMWYDRYLACSIWEVRSRVMPIMICWCPPIYELLDCYCNSYSALFFFFSYFLAKMQNGFKDDCETEPPSSFSQRKVCYYCIAQTYKSKSTMFSQLCIKSNVHVCPYSTWCLGVSQI